MDPPPTFPHPTITTLVKVGQLAQRLLGNQRLEAHQGPHLAPGPEFGDSDLDVESWR